MKSLRCHLCDFSYQQLAAIVAASLLCAPAAAKDPLSRFGYYYGDSEAYGHYMDKVVIPSDGTRLQDFTNLILIDIGTNYGQSNPRRAVIDAANLGYQVLLYGATGFDKDTPGTWQAGLDEYQSVVKGYERFIYAVDLTDEPDGRGWSRTQIESLVDQAKGTFRGSMPVTVNLDIPAIQPPPRNMDVYMFDYYVNGSYAMTTKPEYDATVNGIISAIRTAAPGKPMLMLGSSFNDNSIGFTRPTNEQTQWYFDTARETPEIDALMWFMLGNAPPTSTGAIAYQDLLDQHKQMGQQVLVPRPDLKVDDRVNYAIQEAANAVYSGVAPTLTSTIEHGNNGGKSFRFGPGAENATRSVSNGNQPGSVEAFVYDDTFAASHQIGFRALNELGQSITIYARGNTANYLIDDEANNRMAVDSGVPSLTHWQKVEFAFDGLGVRVYADSQLVYLAPGGWSGGYTHLGFSDPLNSVGVGYVDDILAYQRAPAGTILNFGANQALGTLALNGSRVNVGQNAQGQPAPADVQVQTLHVGQSLAGYLNPMQSGDSVTVAGEFMIDVNSTLVKEGAGILTINAPQTHDSGALLIVDSGTVVFNTDAGSVVSSNLNIDIGGAVQLNTSQHLQSLSVREGGMASLAAGGRFIHTRSLSVTGTGSIDLTDGRAIVDYWGVTGPALTQVRSLLVAGYAAGAWDGAGGIGSSIAAVSTGLSLGYAESSDVLAGPFPVMFGGAEVDDTSVLVRFTYSGDADLNGVVNSLDFNRMIAGYGADAGWTQGDFNYDQKVNTLDFNLLAGTFGLSLPGGGAILSSPVPEPGHLLLPALLLPLTGRRGRRPFLSGGAQRREAYGITRSPSDSAMNLG